MREEYMVNLQRQNPERVAAEAAAYTMYEQCRSGRRRRDDDFNFLRGLDGCGEAQPTTSSI
jgi:hypothetical protein